MSSLQSTAPFDIHTHFYPSIAAGDVKPYFGGVLLPAPHEEYEARSQRLPQTMYIRRPQLENLLRRLLLGSPSNVRTLVGSVRGLDVDRGSHARVASVLVRTPTGEEISMNDPTLVVGMSVPVVDGDVNDSHPMFTA